MPQYKRYKCLHLLHSDSIMQATLEARRTMEFTNENELWHVHNLDSLLPAPQLVGFILLQ